MLLTSPKMFFVFVLCTCLVGCSGFNPQTKAPVSEPKITEEDISDDRGAKPRVEEQDQAPAFSGPPAPPVEVGPPTGETGSKQPRRFIWRDKKGSGKNWESPSEASE